MIVQKMSQSDDGFWNLMGPFFASAKVKRNLGLAINSDESYKWILAFEEGCVTGFVAVVPGKNCEHVKHLYAVNSDESVLAKLLKSIIKTKSLKLAVVSSKELPIYESHGFVKTGKTKGQYFEVQHG